MFIVGVWVFRLGLAGMSGSVLSAIFGPGAVSMGVAVALIGSGVALGGRLMDNSSKNSQIAALQANPQYRQLLRESEALKKEVTELAQRIKGREDFEEAARAIGLGKSSSPQVHSRKDLERSLSRLLLEAEQNYQQWMNQTLPSGVGTQIPNKLF